MSKINNCLECLFLFKTNKQKCKYKTKKYFWIFWTRQWL